MDTEVHQWYLRCMATFQKRGDKWRAIVRQSGHKAQTKTFPNKELAKRWARSIELQMDKGLNVTKPDGRLHKLLLKYEQEVTPKKLGWKWETTRLKRLRKDLPNCKLDSDLVGELFKWRDKRAAEVSGSSINREMNLISSVFTHAIKEWRMNLRNPVKLVGRPKSNPPRHRRILPAEEQQILELLGYDGTQPKWLRDYVPYVFIFAIETAMRLGEILNLEWDHVHEKWVHVSKTKTMVPRDVPLSQRAKEVLDKMPRTSSRVFPVHASSFDVLWRKKRPKGLTFHDTRHEALSRMAKKVPFNVLAKISGHRDPQVLFETYYNPTAEELASYL